MSEFDKVRNFENVKVGDPVIYHTSFGGHITKVTRVTKVAFAIECCGNQLFNKVDGERRGGNIWNISHCTIATEESIAEIEKEKKKKELVNKVNSQLSQIKVKALSIEQLEALSSYLKEYVKVLD